jgi:hypothetical protein
MQRLLALTILLFICSTSFGQIDSAKTKFIIIGTIHTGNKYFNHRTLYKILVKLNPDIILWEQSTKFERVFGLRTANFLKIWNPGIEQLALQKYSRLNRSIQILPFDTTIPSRKHYLKNLVLVRDSFNDRLYNAKKSISDSIIYADFAHKYNLYYSFIDTSTLSRINQGDIIDQSRELHYEEEEVILPLGRKYISDSLVVNKFASEIQFWNDRNEHMMNEIIKYSKQFADKRIIILTGLNHKYYLLDKLKDRKGSDVRIIDFFDN